MQVYLVGGAVRDRLLGLSVKDRDWVVVGATPEELAAKGYQPVGEDFPVFLHPQTHEEYALARTERKAGRGYKGFRVYSAVDVTLEQDLRRRDLTINAIAEDLNGHLIDPFNGQADVEARILRHVSPAFIEDPLRVLRLARFAARLSGFGFTVAEETQSLLLQIVRSGELNDLVPERVCQELLRALDTSKPSSFLRVLRQCGALQALFPELDRLYGVPNPPKWHPEVDSGVHNEMVIDRSAELSTQTSVRFAAMMHDVGKGLTPINKWPSHPGHEATGVVAVKAFCERWRLPNEHKVLACLVTEYHGKLHRIEEMTAKSIVKLLQSVDAFRRPDRFNDFILACQADAQGRPGFENCDYSQAELLKQALQAATHIEISDLKSQGLSGEKMREAIYRKRVQAVSVVLAQRSQLDDPD